MYHDYIQKQLKKYKPTSIEQEKNALKEILQDIILYSLSTTNFFSKAAFHGGTSLRILYDLPRFSEDLDFQLHQPNPDFVWEYYQEHVIKCCQLFGIIPEFSDKSRSHKAVKKMFLKDSTMVKIVNLSFQHDSKQKLMIKLELDSNPPKGAVLETQFIDFPEDAAITCHDLSTNFAGKLNAMLCREFTKGRDWYDFLWYLKQNITPNHQFMSNALHQAGPHQDKNILVTPSWLTGALQQKIAEINWAKAKQDTEPFLQGLELSSLDLWSEAFFLAKIKKLKL